MPEESLLNELIARRWSPKGFADRAVEADKFRSLFEGARWAASSFNEQPWRFTIATKDNPAEFARMLQVLMPMNQQWAASAYAVGFSAGKRTFAHNGTANRFALHDTGASLANLMLQATAVGVHVHAMGGFDAAKARADYGVPEDFEVGAAFAIGYAEGPDVPPATRSRRPLSELVFAGGWGKPVF